MSKRFTTIACLSLLVFFSGQAAATNGDNLIGVGPISRAMGGVGIAAPQDAISAVFANPAAMCFGPVCNASEMDFAGTLFMPEVEAKVTGAGGTGTFSAQSDDPVYAIPAIGISVPITTAAPLWRFGLAAFGVTGLGVDYRQSAIDRPGFFDFPPPFPDAPLVAGEFSQLQILRFAPAIAYQAWKNVSFGLAAHVDYSSLDLRQGSKFNFGFGVQGGMIYKPTENLSVGLNYVTPRKVTHEKVNDFDGDGLLDDLDLEAPQEAGLGIAYMCAGNKLLMEADFKWLNWADAEGYGDFDWDNQWVFGLGAQYEAVPGFFLRAGYNYAKNPVNEHQGFVGSSLTSVQGKTLPTYFFETFRIIGFPGIVEHHMTFGVGYAFTPAFSVNLGYVHAFENTITETGTDPFGFPVSLESTLVENSIDFGMIWRF